MFIEYHIPDIRILDPRYNKWWRRRVKIARKIRDKQHWY